MKFEENLKRLEELVAKMESGGLKLEEMIASYEEGVKLVASCTADLDSIKQRIEKVTGAGCLAPCASCG